MVDKIECAEYQDAVYEHDSTAVGTTKVFRCMILSESLIPEFKVRQAEFPHMVSTSNVYNIT